MNIKVGLVGLPNVGKSSLFNALTKSSVPAENYPFCTIDPHIANTAVPDERLEILKNIYNSKKIIASYISFVDIAGLVAGASKGEGLGNQFLNNIREVDLIIHVLRCFEDSNITREQGPIDPITDYEIIVNELMLKDLESVEKRLLKIALQQKNQALPAQEKKELADEAILLNQIKTAINAATPEKIMQLVTTACVKTIPLLCAKNFLIVANLSELDADAQKNNIHFSALIAKFGIEKVIPISVKTELEFSTLDTAEALELQNELNVTSNLATIITQAFKALNCINFFTCGAEEIHSWTIKNNTTIKTAAGTIHSDLERGFICAEVFNFNELQTHKNIANLKKNGVLKIEGANYIMRDGDIILIRFNI